MLSSRQCCACDPPGGSTGPGRGGAESAVYGCVVCRACVQVVFPDVEAAFYEHEEVQSIMLYVLRHYHFLADVDRGTGTFTARTSARQRRDAVGNEHTHTHTRLTALCPGLPG